MPETFCRKCQQYSKSQAMLKNNITSLLNTAFLDAKHPFIIPTRTYKNEKQVDFVAAFGHHEYICDLSEKTLLPSTRVLQKAQLQFQ